MGYFCSSGVSGKWKNEITGHAHINTIYVIEHLFRGLKQILPRQERL